MEEMKVKDINIIRIEKRHYNRLNKSSAKYESLKWNYYSKPIEKNERVNIFFFGSVIPNNKAMKARCRPGSF